MAAKFYQKPKPSSMQVHGASMDVHMKEYGTIQIGVQLDHE